MWKNVASNFSMCHFTNSAPHTPMFRKYHTVCVKLQRHNSSFSKASDQSHLSGLDEELGLLSFQRAPSMKELICAEIKTTFFHENRGQENNMVNARLIDDQANGVVFLSTLHCAISFN